MIKLPFTVPNKSIVELSEDKLPKYKGWKCSKRFKPFEDRTAIVCEKYGENKYLFVLDFDYESKWENPVYKNFKYKDTYTRETKHGLHLFYFSNVPCRIIQSKKNLHIDLRRLTTIGEKNNKRGNYIVLYDLGVKDLPVMEIDCNIVIAELYNSNGEDVRRYEDNIIYRSNASNYNIKNANVTDYHRSIAEYLKYYNEDWEHGYYLGFELGLKLGSILQDELEAEAVATALMQIVQYPYKTNWIINFVNGYNLSDERECTIGEFYLHPAKLNLMENELQEAKDKMNKEQFITEISRELHNLRLKQYIDIIKRLGL